MPDARKRREGEHSILAQIIAIRLRQLELQSPNVESVIKKLGVGWGTYFDLLHARGNPTLRTVEHVRRAAIIPCSSCSGHRQRSPARSDASEH